MFAYENLEIYKKAFSQNLEVYALLKGKGSVPQYLKNQLGRASLSIMLNIAEGSGRFTSKDRRNFFVMARSSAFECAAIVDFLLAAGEIENEDRSRFKAGFEEISKVLFVMIRNLEK